MPRPPLTTRRPRARRLRARRTVAVLALSAAAVTTALPAAAQAAPAHRGSNPVVSVPVSFRVRNVNHSKVSCPADGKSYTVRGNLVARKSELTSKSVTLYLHGLSFGEFFWRFHKVHGGSYNYARRQALAGQASVIVDRLGYGSSGKPNGNEICVGSRATVAHQMVQDLKSGHYSTPRRHTPSFDNVFLAGHSYGGQIAQVEAYSFHDIAGLIVVSYSDTGQTALTKKSGAYAAKVCASGGMPAPGGAPHYAPFGPPTGARAALFNDVNPGVFRAVKPELSIDPCGDGKYFAKATAKDLKALHRIHVPVFLIQGGADALFSAAKQKKQASLYTGSPDVSRAVVPHAAHAITLERPHGKFIRDMTAALERFERLSS